MDLIRTLRDSPEGRKMEAEKQDKRCDMSHDDSLSEFGRILEDYRKVKWVSSLVRNPTGCCVMKG